MCMFGMMCTHEMNLWEKTLLLCWGESALSCTPNPTSRHERLEEGAGHPAVRAPACCGRVDELIGLDVVLDSTLILQSVQVEQVSESLGLIFVEE